MKYKEIRSCPVDFDELYQMYSMDLEEYLKDCYENSTPVTASIHQTMCKLFYSYIVVGGMPDVVQTYVNTHDIA